MKVLLVIVLLFMFLAACGYQTEEGYFFYTADPSLSAGFQWLATPEPPPLPTPEPEVLPQECVVKGNVSASGEKIYHVCGQANYDRVVIDPEHGERYFDSEEEAVAAGWRKSLR